MSAFPLQWHEKRLSALRSSLERRAKDVEDAQSAYDNCRKQILMLEGQLVSARHAGKASFDPDKYLQVRK